MTDTKLTYRWPVAALVLAVVLALLGVIYRASLLSMVQIWNESDTFSHGYLVFPAVAFLVYRSRERLAAIAPFPSLAGLLLLCASLALWFVARVGEVQVAEQFAVVMSIFACTWTVLGGRVVRAALFALLFMFFAVPFGDFIIPTLMEFTAWFVVEAVELSGIPVYRDGFMLSIPRGDFEVAKACSGIRYLIASVSLGSFFAYLTYRSLHRRLIFLGVAFLVPILANGLRAYGIVMIAHWSNMEYAVGVDHLIYGWLFFGAIMFLMFFAGGRFAEYPPESETWPQERSRQLAPPAMMVPAVAVLALMMAPLLADRALANIGESLAAASMPRAADGWRSVEAGDRGYVPAFKNYDDLKRREYRSDGGAVAVSVHSYTDPQAELVHAGNIFIATQGHKIIRNVAEPFTVGDETWTIGRVDMLEFATQRSILYWYQIGDRRTTSVNTGKLYEWLARLRGEPTRRALVTMSAPVSRGDGVPELLREFVDAHARQLALCVVSPGDDACLSTEAAQ